MEKQTYLSPAPLTEVTVTDHFWRPVMETTRREMIPYQWRVLNNQEPEAEKSSCIRNFRIAAGLEEGEFEGKVFQDSDLAKWIEAAAYSLCWHPDKELELKIDSAVDLIAKAQQPDGYIGTYYTITGLEKRWTNLTRHHELYCAGHLTEAAVAYYQATGKRKFLDLMIRCADYIDSVFGPEDGKLHGYPGHEEIELALIRLFHVTGEKRYLNLARYFIDERGKQPCYFQKEIEKYHYEFPWADSSFQFGYYQAGEPVREAQNACGHAVRAVYLYSAMADAARETGDESLYAACRRMWDSITERQMYLTGSIGSSAYGEAFSADYDLPNDLIYGETCAAVGMAFFASRMLTLSPEGKYGDILERLLYNGTISGMSLDGKRFFYVNPLEVCPELNEKVQAYRHVKPVRQKWFACACCPPNLARLVESVGGYIYSARKNTLFIHLFIGSQTKQQLESSRLSVSLQTGWPWKGDTEIRVWADAPAELAVRIPEWCGSFTLSRDSGPVCPRLEKGYAYFPVPAGNSVFRLSLPLRPRVLRASAKVREDFGKAAVVRGPVVYCLEEADNGKDLFRLQLTDQPDFTEEYLPGLLGGVVRLQARGWRWEEPSGPLYSEEHPLIRRETTLTFVPYYAWNNRSPGEMAVWVRKDLR